MDKIVNPKNLLNSMIRKGSNKEVESEKNNEKRVNLKVLKDTISKSKLNEQVNTEINEDERSSLEREESSETLGDWAKRNGVKVEWEDEGLRLNEMSKLGPFGHNFQKDEDKPPQYLKPAYIIQIYYEPLGNQTFHLRHKNKGDKDFFEVRIQIKDFIVLPESEGIAKGKKKIPQEVFDLMIDFLKKPYKGSNISNWEQLINFWNANNEKKYCLPDNSPMPNVNGFSYKK